MIDPCGYVQSQMKKGEINLDLLALHVSMCEVCRAVQAEIGLLLLDDGEDDYVSRRTEDTPQ